MVLTSAEAKMLYKAAKTYYSAPKSPGEDIGQFAVKSLLESLENGNLISANQYDAVLYVLAWVRKQTDDLTRARSYTRIIDKVHAAAGFVKVTKLRD